MLLPWNKTGNLKLRSIGVLLALAAAPLAVAQNEASPDEVSLYLNVETSKGLVTGLGPRNFRLYQDGQPQQFRLEKPEEQASIALLVEYSRSSVYFAEEIETAIQGFGKHAREGHWYALATYSKDLEINADFTSQTGLIADAYRQLGSPSWSEINSYDAVYEMLDKLGRLPGRRILVVIGSGLDTFSEHTLDDVKKKMETENVTVFAAGLGSLFRTTYDMSLSSADRTAFTQARAFLQMLSSDTGGCSWFPSMAIAFTDVMEGIMQSIDTEYRLVYAPKVRGSGKLHKIRVEAFRLIGDKREDFKVLVRSGWR